MTDYKYINAYEVLCIYISYLGLERLMFEAKNH